jgi:prepilin-type N-terminal cleavage/methylation domain-containing protein
MPCTARSATFTNVKCSARTSRHLDETLCHAPGRPIDDGFTLIELLIVIVVLGMLATVVVFSVRGIVDRGEQSSQEIDQRMLVTALENYYARNGVYATEAELVAAGFIRRESERHDITLTPDRANYVVIVVP